MLLSVVGAVKLGLMAPLVLRWPAATDFSLGLNAIFALVTESALVQLRWLARRAS